MKRLSRTEAPRTASVVVCESRRPSMERRACGLVRPGSKRADSDQLRSLWMRAPTFASFWSSVNRIATYFNITDDEAYSLYEAAELVVRERFQGHLDDIAKTLQSAATSRPTSRPVNGITGPSSGED